MMFLTTWNIISAQQASRRQLDSTLELAARKAPDTTRARLMHEVAELYLKSNQPDSALFHALQSEQLMQEQHYHYGRAKSLFVLGKIYARTNKLDKSEAAYNEVRRLMQPDTSAPAMRLYAIATGNLSAVIGRKGNPDRELEMLLSVIPIFEKLNDTLSLSVSMFNIASKFINAGQPQKAHPYLLKNIAMVRIKGQPENKANAYITAATLLLQMDSVPQAGQYLAQARTALDAAGASSLWGPWYLYDAMYESRNGHFKVAEQRCEQADSVITIWKDKNNHYNLLTARLKIYEAQGKYAAAIGQAREIYKLAAEDGSAYYHLSSLKDLYQLHEKAGRLKESFTYLKAYTELKDSLDQRQIKVRINELEQQYQASENERRILELKNQNSTQQLALQQGYFRQMIYLFALLVVIVVLFLLFLLLRNRQRISRQRQQLLERELEKVKHEQTINNYAAMLNGQEQERSRLARELHDGLGGRLSALQLNLTKLPENALGIKETLSHQLETSMMELRQIARDLTPVSLSRFGLADALKDDAHTLKEAGINIILQVLDLSNDIPYPVQLMLYRIVQESVTNAVRHAAATRILVQCSQQDNIIYITVEDDGKGFDPAGTQGGSGMENIKARVSHLNGVLDIQSAPGAGTIINIECKLP